MIITRVIGGNRRDLFAELCLPRIEIGKHVEFDAVEIVAIDEQRPLGEVVAAGIIERNGGSDARFDQVIAPDRSPFGQDCHMLRVAILVRSLRLHLVGTAGQHIAVVGLRMKKMPLRRKPGAVELVRKRGDQLAGFIVLFLARLVIVGLPGLSSGRGLRVDRGPESTAHFRPLIDPVDRINESRTPCESRVAVEVGIKQIDGVIEHVILAGIVRENDVTAWTRPLVAVSRDGDESTGCERQQRITVLIEEGSGRRLGTANRDAVTAQRPVTAARSRCEQVVIAIVLPKICAFKYVVDGDLLFGCRVGGEAVRRELADADAAVKAAVGDVTLSPLILDFIGIDDRAENRRVVWIRFGRNHRLPAIFPGTARMLAGCYADGRAAGWGGCRRDVIQVVFAVEVLDRGRPEIRHHIAHPARQSGEHVTDVRPVHQVDRLIGCDVMVA